MDRLLLLLEWEQGAKCSTPASKVTGEDKKGEIQNVCKNS